MGDIVNLRGARKRRARALADAKSTVNRIKFGVRKSAKKKAEAERRLAEDRLEAHRRAEHGDGD